MVSEKKTKVSRLGGCRAGVYLILVRLNSSLSYNAVEAWKSRRPKDGEEVSRERFPIFPELAG